MKRANAFVVTSLICLILSACVTIQSGQQEEKLDRAERVKAVTTSYTTEALQLSYEIDRLAKETESRMIEWRRDFHKYPELSNREFRTSKIVAKHLQNLGLEVRAGIAHTGVVGILQGKKDKPVIALRADMDALPVTELADVPFASVHNGVMHACGHDTHTAMLMAVAEVLSKMRDRLPGTVKFIFQPAEEGAPEGEEHGAALMIKEGVLKGPEPDTIFGLHVAPYDSGSILFRPGGIMAGANKFRIIVKGKGTHAGMPWDGVDPIVVSSQIILGLQTIVSRQTDLTQTPAVISVGMIKGGTRNNIIPPEVEMEGTIRIFDPKMREAIHKRIKRTASAIAESAGASAEVTVSPGIPVTFNDPDLTAQMTSTLERVVGKNKIMTMNQATVAEDFAFYAEKIPGLYISLGITPVGTEPIPNHSPYFIVDESALIVGVRAMANMAVDFLEGGL